MADDMRHVVYTCWSPGQVWAFPSFMAVADAKAHAADLAKRWSCPVYVMQSVAVVVPGEAPVSWTETTGLESR